uniref:Uncharacterized protein n=1 Tax=Polynucleobacter necessarius subsp. necessarius (strain STIR1) TaxID=452638 RepID=B1XTA1_POLNS
MAALGEALIGVGKAGLVAALGLCASVSRDQVLKPSA